MNIITLRYIGAYIYCWQSKEDVFQKCWCKCTPCTPSNDAPDDHVFLIIL